MRTAFTREERRTQTRAELLDAAERLFSEQGFHTTSVDQVADDAGYTKGAVYSNFVSKEDLFFAVYERRVDRARRGRGVAARRRGPTRGWAASPPGAAHEDGWLAVFFEFWAHVLRHPELRERFAKQHRRGIGPYGALERVAAERGEDFRRNRPSWPPRVTRCSSASSSSA